MELNLHDHPLPQVSTGGISIDSLTWWFWVKAGAGLAVGATTIGFVLAVVTWFTVGAFGSVLLALARHSL